MNILENPATAPESERAFSEAVKLYEALRLHDPHSDAYGTALVDLVRSCQGVIAVDGEHGEAHVLLAYSYYLLHLHVYALGCSNPALLLAAATIQHWSDQPIRQHLSAANVEKGCRVYDLIAGELAEMEPECADREEIEMRYLETKEYSRALVADPGEWMTMGSLPK